MLRNATMIFVIQRKAIAIQKLLNHRKLSSKFLSFCFNLEWNDPLLPLWQYLQMKKDGGNSSIRVASFLLLNHRKLLLLLLSLSLCCSGLPTGHNTTFTPLVFKSRTERNPLFVISIQIQKEN